MEERYFNTAEVAKLLKCKTQRVCAMAQARRLKGEMVAKGPHDRGRGTVWRFHERDVLALREQLILEDGTRIRQVGTQPIIADRDDLLWFAGWFGGEGCITIQRRQRDGAGWTLQILLPNSCQRVQRTLPSLFGGSCHLVKKARPESLQQIRWQCSGRQAANVLKTILPYLRNKREEAELAILFQENMDRANNSGRRPISSEDRAFRDAAYEKLRWWKTHPE